MDIEEFKKAAADMNALQKAKVGALIVITLAMRSNAADETKFDLIQHALDAMGSTYADHICMKHAEIIAAALPSANTFEAFKEGVLEVSEIGTALIEVSQDAEKETKRSLEFMKNLLDLLSEAKP